jgi:eukaryotic-like serine/threonine-protein kinase
MDQLTADEWHSLSSSLDRALELEEGQREDWLAALETQDPATAMRVRRLVAALANPDFGSFLLEPASFPSQEEAPAATLIGRSVGPYLIDEEIGRGGMGSVWRARRMDGRYAGTVAIKFVHAAWIGRQGEQRFRLEGQLLGRLDHPHIARLLDAGVLEGTQPYLILEYVAGEPIDAYCERQPLEMKARIGLFLDVLAAVSHAHSHLIVHRDLKPANIFVTRDGTVKLLDFGVAKLLEDELESSPSPPTSAVALTPRYAAPEQILGQPVSTATDVYALGLVLYLLLTGTHPFSSGPRSHSAALNASLSDAPARASSVAGIAGIPGRLLQGDLDNILHKALKKNPLERYASAGAFAEDLRRFLGHQPVLARPDSWRYRTAKFARRNRTALLFGGLAAAALVAASMFTLVQMLDARAQRDLALLAEAHANAETELTEFLLGDSLSQAPHEVARLRLNRAREMIHRRFRNEPLLQARLLMGLSGRYLDAGDFKAGTEVTQEAEAIGRRLDDPHLNADIACGNAENAVEKGRLSAARQDLALADTNMGRLKIVPVQLAAQCAMAAAYVAHQEDDNAKAVRLMRDSMRMLERAGQQRSTTYASVVHEYVRSLSMSGDYRDAWTAEQSVIALVKDVGRDDSDAYYATVNVGAAVLISGGQPRKALELIGTTVAKSQEIAATAALPFYLEATRLLAAAAMGASPPADSGLMQAADVAEKQGLLSALPIYRSAAVEAALTRGDLATAEKDWQILSPLEAKLVAAGTQPRDAIRVLLQHCNLELARTELSGAEQRLQQAIALIPAARRSTHPDWRQAVLLRAKIEYARRDYASALRNVQVAVDQARAHAIDPQSSAWIGEALLWRARIEAARGDAQSARASAREALPHLMANLDAQHPAIAVARGLAATPAP